MAANDAARYERLAKEVTDPDLKKFYKAKADEAKKAAAVRPKNMAEVERVTKAYAAALRRLGVNATDIEFVAEDK